MLILFLGWFWYWITLSINTMSELKTILSGRISGYEAQMMVPEEQSAAMRLLLKKVTGGD